MSTSNARILRSVFSHNHKLMEYSYFACRLVCFPDHVTAQPCHLPLHGHCEPTLQEVIALLCGDTGHKDHFTLADVSLNNKTNHLSS